MTLKSIVRQSVEPITLYQVAVKSLYYPLKILREFIKVFLTLKFITISMIAKLAN